MPPFLQHALDCRDHTDCTAIVCTDEATGRTVWVSHQEAKVDPAERINPTVPALDKRGQKHINGLPGVPIVHKPSRS